MADRVLLDNGEKTMRRRQSVCPHRAYVLLREVFCGEGAVEVERGVRGIMVMEKIHEQQLKE